MILYHHIILYHYIICYYIILYYIILYCIKIHRHGSSHSVSLIFRERCVSVSTFVGQAPAYGLSEVLEILCQRVVTAFSSPFRRGKSDSYRHSEHFGAAMDIASSNQTWQILLYIIVYSICIITIFCIICYILITYDMLYIIGYMYIYIILYMHI